ncbi:hypothetical protein NLM59_10495 [Weeksellaceae bacterium KMM 9724]|nr:hypothetical protein [Profundicola chukchiensis]MDG4951356.1 hypothetical protein [Profundicola chukchiensis]
MFGLLGMQLGLGVNISVTSAKLKPSPQMLQPEAVLLDIVKQSGSSQSILPSPSLSIPSEQAIGLFSAVGV